MAWYYVAYNTLPVPARVSAVFLVYHFQLIKSAMELDDRAWKNLNGGYKMPFDASGPLKKLRDATQPGEHEPIFSLLWENLHHQGDVGLASYLAVPHLVAACVAKKSLDWNYIGLCSLIENCRLESHNPELPAEYQDYYFGSLIQFEKYLLLHFKDITDKDALRSTLSLFATVNGQPALGKAIEKLDEDVLAAFHEQY